MKIIILDFFIGEAFVYYDYNPDKYENKIEHNEDL